MPELKPITIAAISVAVTGLVIAAYVHIEKMERAKRDDLEKLTRFEIEAINRARFKMKGHFDRMTLAQLLDFDSIAELMRSEIAAAKIELIRES